MFWTVLGRRAGFAAPQMSPGVTRCHVLDRFGASRRVRRPPNVTRCHVLEKSSGGGGGNIPQHSINPPAFRTNSSEHHFRHLRQMRSGSWGKWICWNSLENQGFPPIPPLSARCVRRDFHSRLNQDRQTPLPRRLHADESTSVAPTGTGYRRTASGAKCVIRAPSITQVLQASGADPSAAVAEQSIRYP